MAPIDRSSLATPGPIGLMIGAAREGDAMRLRSGLGLVALLALGGCNVVATDTPMFTAADGAGAPAIRSGVWRQDKTDCAFDEALPQNRWPKCADAQPGVADPPFWLEVNGDPALLQLPFPKSAIKDTGTSYLYAAYRPTKRDRHGRVIAMKLWLVRCGPAAADTDGAAASAAAAAPAPPTWPGLTMSSDGNTCTPDGTAPLRNAARGSEAEADADSTSHWVRDPRPGDLPLLTAAVLATMAEKAN